MSSGSEFLLGRRLHLKEAELKTIDADLSKEFRKVSAPIDPKWLRQKVMEQLGDLSALFREDPVTKLQQYVSSVWTTPNERDEERFYVADGDWGYVGICPNNDAIPARGGGIGLSNGCGGWI
jgi:hypothetical protein